MIMATQNNYRVTYINALDGQKRVLVGSVDLATAQSVVARFGNKRDRLNYMGPGVAIDLDDGTPDGAAIAKAQS